MRRLLVVPSIVVPAIIATGFASIVACGSSTPSPPAEPKAPPQAPWSIPAGFRSETIPFPLEFAPGLAHRGTEELRFAPGFFDPAAPGYWSYAFVWRTEDPAVMDAAAVASELTAYFRGLIEAVDEAKQIANKDEIVAHATPDGGRMVLTVHIFDAFKTRLPVDLVGWAERRACGTGALWSFVLAPAQSPLRLTLDALAATAACDQPVPPPPPHEPSR